MKNKDRTLAKNCNRPFGTRENETETGVNKYYLKLAGISRTLRE